EEQRRLAAALGNAGLLRSAVEQQADRAGLGILPLLRRHFLAARIEPGRIFDPDLLVPFRAEKAVLAQHRIAAAERGEPADKARELLAVLVMVPIYPGNLVVLAIAVVIAVLRPAELVAAEDHRRTLGQQQRREHVALLPLAQRDDVGIVGRTFGAVIPGAIVGMAVAIVFAVRLVVL